VSLAEEIMAMADDGLERIHRVRSDLNTLREHDGDRTWIEPVDAVLAVVGEMVEKARSSAEAGDTSTWDPELTHAIEQLKSAVLGLTSTLTGKGSKEPTSSGGEG
jgi:hypothetical protein